MQELLNIDIGHLLSRQDHADFISPAEFENFAPRYGQAFEEFQAVLRDKKSPITLSFGEEAAIPRIKELARELGEKYDNVLLLGIGGSALGARAVLQFLHGPFYNLEQHSHPRLFILDNLDPVLVNKAVGVIDMARTAIIYTSKSGSTPETAAQFIYFYNRYKEAGGRLEDIVIICDPGDNGINHIARQLNCRLLHIPRDLPGRYSVLSSVGFLPAEVTGTDSARLLAGAATAHQSIADTPLQQNALFALGTCLYELAVKGKSIHVLFNYSSMLYEFGLWFVQLWAESLGKRLSLDGKEIHAGTTPLASLGATDQHSILQLFKEGPADKVLGFVTIENQPVDITLPEAFPGEKEYAYFTGHTMGRQLSIEQLATEMTLVGAGKPCYRVTLREISPEVLGALFYFYEALVVYTGRLWNINPFDQPGVEEGKNITYALMGRQDYSQKRPAYQEAVSRYQKEGVRLKV
ncbi:glucose-6-phosphate isomerase [Desulfallas thermosapovorans]|uniref:Glucose-6-phosphate isomerase n=1 Tax=Desulfallas thermosapovorans DSM 6562 TaxID=1121431 RepID=A0A5S4ZRX4_9FIRM|nr:glucose-6-phosphate isomerase [Desulfallas thermosapovorans]TYO94846.1 glucose-6-phosphate isomerase [Desulfallas thermosapovorans DSM 6562]